MFYSSYVKVIPLHSFEARKTKQIATAFYVEAGKPNVIYLNDFLLTEN